MHQLYDSYGIEAFKNIQFLAPAYITTTGDIFGMEDIDINGMSSNNHKIVVVQTFNLYQQLTTRYAGEIAKVDSFKDNIINNPVEELHIHAAFIIFIITLISILIWFILLFNDKK